MYGRHVEQKALEVVDVDQQMRWICLAMSRDQSMFYFSIYKLQMIPNYHVNGQCLFSFLSDYMIIRSRRSLLNKAHKDPFYDL
jgi:hypothetical protein